MPYAEPIISPGASTSSLGVDLGSSFSDAAKGPATITINAEAVKQRLAEQGLLKSRSGDNLSKISVHPPTPPARNTSDPLSRQHQDSPSSVDSGSSAVTKSSRSSLTSSPATSTSASSSLMSLAVHQQVLPEVRSPPRKQAELPAEAAAINQARGRRPRLFGFTEIPDDGSGGSQTSSATGSAHNSRENSPTRLDSISARFDQSSSRKAADALTFVPRRHTPKSSRRSSAAGSPPIARDFEARPAEASATSPPATSPPATSPPATSPSLSRPTPSALRPGPARPSLSTRTSAQRNEGSLKLDLKGLKQSQGLATDGTQISPAALIRKKSGEILKPSLKSVSSFTSLESQNYGNATKSCPNTPSFPKYVHFDTHLERVKLFLKEQKPQVVSRDGSPADYTTSEGEEFPFPATDEETEVRYQLEIRLPNFPVTHAVDADLYLEALFLDEDRKNLKGIVRVRNLAFQKWVAVRYTTDWWQTTSEVTATHKDSIQGGVFDRFQFTLKLSDMLAKIEEKTLFLALRYTTDGREIWDNNGGSNYQVTFVKAKVQPKGLAAARPSVSAGSGMIAAGQGRAIGGRSSQWNLQGQQQDRMADLRQQLNRLTEGDLGSSPPEDKKPVGVRDRAAALAASYGGGPLSPSGGTRNKGPGSLNGLPKRGDRSLEAGPPSPLASPLAARYDFGSAWNKSSPKKGGKDLPDGLRFNSGAATGPSMEFYSPQLPMKDLPETMSARSQDRPVIGPERTGQSLAAPVLQVQEPSPSPPKPVETSDYFSAEAPVVDASRAGTVNKSSSAPTSGPEVSRTALPRMYSLPPVLLSPQPERSISSDSLSSADDGWSAPRRFDARDGVISGSADNSPPSISSTTSSTYSPSPVSPPQAELPTWSPEKAMDVAHIDYSSFLEQFCWGGGENFPAPKPALEGRRTHSTSSVDKFFSHSLFNRFTSPRSMSPIDTPVGSGFKTPTNRSSTPNGNSTSWMSTTPTQSDYEGSTLLDRVSRSLNSSPHDTPMASPSQIVHSCAG